ncbi:MAG: 4-hydroxy-3-methylbut-2-enyl diphosphate reductase [Desulfobacteraceae bacterium]|jgi:4-hydroxy-3-methylbut-2-enyl diphosphate reductase|nr:4-hydroxy-3-methylbut-2-enyl diphosphate reductase [Desulfobacteraceae bacterium]
MKILIAKTSGFCMGVRRAVEMVLDAPDQNKNPIFTYGPLIHNPQVLDLLKSKDITALDEIPSQGNGTVLIRAHGVPPSIKEKLKEVNFNVIDATCPRVIKVQTIIRKHSKKGFTAIIIGDKDHPEVIGLQGYARDNGFVIGSMQELEALPDFENAIIVAQTTQNTQFFESAKNWAAAHHPHYKVFNTICDSTERRQAEVMRLAAAVDAVIVVGGRNSGNTRRLAEIASESGKPTYHIESETDLNNIDTDALVAARYIGITAGASTPNWIIKKVYRALESLQVKRGESWRRILFGLQRALLLTNIYVSLGAGCLSYACLKLQGFSQLFPYVLISMLYVQSMHILAHLTGSTADQYNDPERANFYSKYKILLTILALAAGSAGLVIALTIGLFPFLLLLVLSLLGLSYNRRFVPNRFFPCKYRRLRDIPGSKTFMIAVAWGIVTALLPALSLADKAHWVTVLIFLWAAGIVFVRTAFFDILDMQGDRIVGKETIAILLGEKRSLRLLKIMLLILIAALLLLSSLHLISYLGFVLVASPISLLFHLSAYERGLLLPSVKLEFLVETNFVLAGVIAFLWSVLGL